MTTLPTFRRRSFAFALAGLVGVALVPAAVVAPAFAQRAQPSSDLKAPPPLPIDTVETILSAGDRDRIRGMVEELLGRKLASAPAVGIVEPNAMRLAIERSMRASQPDATFEAKQIDQLALRQVALYDPSTKSIFVGSGGLASVGEGDRIPVARMLFAQAVARAIIDAELSLANFTAADTPEVALTRRMLTEGLSVTARDRVGMRLGFNPFAPSYRPHLPGMVESREGATLERSLYGTGRLVVEGMWNAKGMEAVWSFMKTKPTTVRELAATVPHARAIALLPAILDQALPAAQWVRARAPMAPTLAVGAMQGLNDEERLSISSHCVATETLGYSGPQGAAVLVSTVRMTDDASAATLAKAILRMPAAIEAELRRVGVQPKATREERTVGGLTFQVTTLGAVNDDSGRTTTILHAMKGRELGMITLSGTQLPAESLDRALEQLAKSLGEVLEPSAAQ